MQKKPVTSLIAYGIIIFSVITAISLMFSIMGLNTIINYQINFPLIAFFSFILFIVFVGLRYRDLSHNSKIGRDIFPSIVIDPLIEKDRFYLKVTNTGDIAAIFVSSLKLSSKQTKEAISQDLREYNGSWNITNNGESKIFKGQSDRIQIAEIQTINYPIVAIHLRAFVYDTTCKTTREIALQSYFPLAVVTHSDGKSGPMDRPEYEIEVCISSDPCMKICPIKKKYLLGINGLEEIKSNLTDETLEEKPSCK
jgi:hypothetical protein